jgi:hypothetical protein
MTNNMNITALFWIVINTIIVYGSRHGASQEKEIEAIVQRISGKCMPLSGCNLLTALMDKKSTTALSG